MSVLINRGARRLDSENLCDRIRAKALDDAIPVVLNLSDDFQKIYVSYPIGDYLERVAKKSFCDDFEEKDYLGRMIGKMNKLLRGLSTESNERIRGELPVIPQEVSKYPFERLEGKSVITLAWGYRDLDYQDGFWIGD